MNKQKRYDRVLHILKTTFATELGLSLQAKMSLISAVLHSEFDHWVFCGFYVMVTPELLEIGPYQGHILACTHIPIGRGVCGISAKEKKTIIVDDVENFPNYISCDSDTKSEIVIPILLDQEVVSILDIDSPFLSDFNQTDKVSLKKITSLI